MGQAQGTELRCVLSMDMNHKRGCEGEAQEWYQARDAGENIRANAVKQSHVQGQQVPGVPHEQGHHEPEQEPLQPPEASLTEDQNHQEEMHQGAKRIDHQLEGHKEGEFRGDVHAATSDGRLEVPPAQPNRADDATVGIVCEGDAGLN
jgi:protein involved in temperature-dependent protein secretion